MRADPAAITAALIRCASVTPADDGAQALLGTLLEGWGFTVHHLRFGATPNLFARFGQGAPHLCFAGHTDVVPPGEGWSHPPFGGEIADGVLYGRGACDMKGAIAAFAAAAAAHGQAGPPRGSISLLITGDEEGPATDGTVRVLEWLQANCQMPDMCLVGEPTNPRALGDVIKIGRRGSLNASITVHGTQGHAAYPHRADNPVHRLVGLAAELAGHRLDDGTDWFEPSSLQLTSLDVGNPAFNVIPASARMLLNIRFNDRHTGASLEAWLRETTARHCPRATIAVAVGGEAFRTEAGDFTTRLGQAITRACGRVPKLDTGGGTSDARFIARHMPVAEFGLVGATMHKTDECVKVVELEQLSAIYAEIIREFLP